MARRSTGTRRRTIARIIANPSRGKRKAPRILSNPRRRTKSRSRSRSRKSRSRKARRSNPRRARRSVKVRAHRRSKARRNPRRSSSRRSSRRRNPYRLSSRSKSGWARTNPRRKGKGRKYSRRSNPRRSRSMFGAFRNPASGITSGIAGMFRKIPLIGAPLALAAVNIPAGILAGVSVEVPLRLSPLVAEQTWVPDIVKTNEWIYFTLLGSIAGGVIATGLTAAKIKLPMGLTPGHIAGMMTAAASGAGYAKMRTRQMANEIGLATPEQQVAGDDAVSGLGALVANGTPMGAITMDGMGMGPAYSVSPGGYGGPMHAVMVGG